MIQKVKQQYYEMGFRLLGGIVVDAELKNKMQEVLDEARKKIVKLIDDNHQHLKETETCLVYPFGEQADVNYIAPKSMYDLDIEKRKALLANAFTMRPVEHLFESDKKDIYLIKSFAQRAIEDEKHPK